jgi:virulence-associated protein VagC
MMISPSADSIEEFKLFNQSFKEDYPNPSELL